MSLRILLLCCLLVLSGCRTPSAQPQPVSVPISLSGDQTLLPLDNEVVQQLINDQRIGETRFLIPLQPIRTKTHGIWQWTLTDESIIRTNTQLWTDHEWLLTFQSPLLLGTQMIGYSLLHTTESSAWIRLKDGLGTRTATLIARATDTGALHISEPWCIPLFILLDTSIVCTQLTTEGNALYSTLMHRTPESQHMIYPTHINSLHTDGTHLLWTHHQWWQTEILIYDTQKRELRWSTRFSWAIWTYHPFIIRDHRVYRGNADQWPSPQSEHTFSSFMRWNLVTNEIVTLE